MPVKKQRIKRIVRPINSVIIHCSATEADPKIGVKQIDEWHRQQGWLSCGYHFVVRTDGTVEEGRDLAEPGAHCRGYNADSIGVCYVGGLDAEGNAADTRTPEQRASLQAIVTVLRSVFPDAQLYGHCDLAVKDSPCYDVHAEYEK